MLFSEASCWKCPLKGSISQQTLPECRGPHRAHGVIRDGNHYGSSHVWQTGRGFTMISTECGLSHPTLIPTP